MVLPGPTMSHRIMPLPGDFLGQESLKSMRQEGELHPHEENPLWFQNKTWKRSTINSFSSYWAPSISIQPGWPLLKRLQLKCWWLRGHAGDIFHWIGSPSVPDPPTPEYTSKSVIIIMIVTITIIIITISSIVVVIFIIIDSSLDLSIEIPWDQSHTQSNLL